MAYFSGLRSRSPPKINFCLKISFKSKLHFSNYIKLTEIIFGHMTKNAFSVFFYEKMLESRMIPLFLGFCGK